MKSGQSLKDTNEVVCFATNHIDDNMRNAILNSKHYRGRTININADPSTFRNPDDLVNAVSRLRNNQVAVILSNRTPTAHVVKLQGSKLPFILVQYDDKNNPDWSDFIDLAREIHEGIWDREGRTLTAST